MESKNHGFSGNRGVLARMLQWVNLRPEEVERTWMMFAFYTTVAVGLRWAEDSTVALFLDQYGAGQLPWVYIASAVLGAGLVGLFSWLQRIFPLRWVIVAIVPCMILPLFLLVLLRWGINVPSIAMVIIFLLRLWVDACYVINDLNTSIVANQLFNIREIKRTYPLVSSGLLVADVISGFSLPVLVKVMTLNQVIMLACLVVICGSGILFLLTYKYKGSFPSTPQRDVPEEQGTRHRRLQTPLKRYVWYLFIFVALLQVMGLLIDFQYLRELNANFGNQDLASFLGLFGGIVGVCELFTQWFVSSRLIEKIGVFSTAALLPITVGFLLPSAIALLSFFPSIQAQTVFWGLVSLKFCDELLRYTFVVSSGPVLYQPIPEEIRSWIQTLSGGTAEAISSGLTGLAIFSTLWVVEKYVPPSLQKWVFVGETVIIAATCLKVVWELRSRYVDLLVLSAERGEVSAATVGLRVFQQGVVKALVETGNTADKGACVELLAQIDLQGAAQVLAPLLPQLAPDLQAKSLEVMLLAGANPAYLNAVRPLLEQSPATFNPELFALALRYVSLADVNPDLSLLEKYLHPQHHSLIRATAAALLLRQGTTLQIAAATNTMQQMLTHSQERERINAVKAFRESIDLQELRVYIPSLLTDKSLRVRCAVLEMIAATRLEQYYSILLTALSYKSTRTTAIHALVRLENNGLPLLLQLATNIYKPEVVRMHAWRTIALIGTIEAQESLWVNLETSWGSTREYILRSLIKIGQQSENQNVVLMLDESRIEALIKEELQFLGEIYAGYIDLQLVNSLDNHQINERVISIGGLLQTALLEVEIDVKDRLLLLLKLLYSPAKIQAATLNLQSESVVSLARGLEILDHTVKLASKSVLLHILDRRPPQEKLQHLIESGIVEREKMPGSHEQELTIIANRLRQLINLGNLLSDWCLACCFHFAQAAHIRVSSDQILVTLRHPTGFVREAAISYLSVVSRKVVQEILPYLKTDPHPLVAAQVQELMKKSAL